MTTAINAGDFFSVNALWKNKIAVLVGDFLLSKGQLLTVENDDFDLLKIISIAVREMSQGELLQIEKSRQLDITEEVYYQIIRQKTATLLATCCEMGAQAVNAPQEDVEKMRQFGTAIGMAFQIKDDLFDYGEAKIGKPLGIDIKEQKMTLPLIHALNVATPSERKKMIHIVKNKNTDKAAVKQLIAQVKSLGGLTFAVEKMKAYQVEALELLHTFPQNTYRDALELMVNYVIDRKH